MKDKIVYMYLNCFLDFSFQTLYIFINIGTLYINFDCNFPQ